MNSEKLFSQRTSVEPTKNWDKISDKVAYLQVLSGRFEAASEAIAALVVAERFSDEEILHILNELSEDIEIWTTVITQKSNNL